MKLYLKIYMILIFSLILLGLYLISGLHIFVFDIGEDSDSRFIKPNTILIFGGYDEFVLRHEVTHYFQYKAYGYTEHDNKFWEINNNLIKIGQ